MSDKPRILTYRELLEVQSSEINEPMLVVQEEAPEIVCQYGQFDMLPYTGERMLIRKTVLEKLRAAQNNLSKKAPGTFLKLVYAYRHPEVQKRYFEEVCKKLLRAEPNLDRQLLNEKAHLLIAVPKVAGHPTGGAVDVTLTRVGKDLDMGTAIADFSKPEVIPTFSDKINDLERENRMLLRAVMLEQEFAPFDGEWWHFCYGDREWAGYYRKIATLYEPIDIRLS